MARDGRMSVKDVGGVEVSERGFTVWLSDDSGGRWTFRIGHRSGLTDFHRSEADGLKETLWVARTSELFGWLELVLTVEELRPWVDGLTQRVTWSWVRERGLWLAPMPTHTEEEGKRIAGLMADIPLEELAGRERSLVPSLLPFDLLPYPLAPGPYLAYPAPASGAEDVGVLLWTPGLSDHDLMWLSVDRVDARAGVLLAPYRADLTAMDRPEVRQELSAFMSRLRESRP